MAHDTEQQLSRPREGRVAVPYTVTVCFLSSTWNWGRVLARKNEGDPNRQELSHAEVVVSMMQYPCGDFPPLLKGF